MPDPITGVLAGASIIGGKKQADASSDAAASQADSANAGIAEQRAARESFEARTQPFADVGLSAADPLQELLGIGGKGNALSQLEEINPLVSFLRDEGFTAIEERAASKSRLGAGGTLKDLTRFNSNLASTVVPQLQNQRFNQLFNVLGLGSNVAAGQGTAALQTASNVSNLLGNAGQAQAQGAIGRSNAITGTIGNLTGIFGAQQGGAFGQPTAATPIAQPTPLGGNALGGIVSGAQQGASFT